MKRATALLLTTALITAACHSRNRLDQAERGELAASSAHTTAALGSMALQAALHEIDPTYFGALVSPPNVVATGNATSGTVTLDLGTGTTVNNATVSGTVVGSYAVSGSAVTVTVTFSGVTVQTNAAGSMATTGSLTVTATLNGSSNVSGAITGSVTTTAGANTTTVIPNLTYDLDGTPSTGNIELAGTMDVDSSVYGDWTATLTTLETTVSQGTRAIHSGTLAMQHNSFLSFTVTMQFTAANAGDLDVSPSGYSKAFTL